MQQAFTPPSPFQNHPTRRITFSDHPIFVTKTSVPIFQYQQPESILKRRNQSLMQDPSFLMHEDTQVAEFKLPVIQKRKTVDRLVFNIEPAPMIPEELRLQRDQDLVKEKISEAGDEKSESVGRSSRVNNSNDDQDREMKIPIWGYLLCGFCALIVGGWIISLALSTKMNQNKSAPAIKRHRHFKLRYSHFTQNQLAETQYND